MSEEMNTVTGTGENQEISTDVKDTGKTFTQDEVNAFVQSRLSQMKKQAAKEANAEIDRRTKDLDVRELRLSMREELSRRGMPQELADVLSVSSAEQIGNTLDRLNEIYGKKENVQSHTGFSIGADSSKGSGADDATARAMGLLR